MSAIESIDRFTVLAERLSANGKKADPIIELIKRSEAAGCQHLMIDLIEWIVDNFDIGPNGGSIDFVHQVLSETPNRRIAVVVDSMRQFNGFVHRYRNDIRDNLTPVFGISDLRGRNWDGFYVVDDALIDDRAYRFLLQNKITRIKFNFVNDNEKVS